ncbi:MAG TPA: Do family serine endopeptidase [Burkholderiaceae bacterium]|nr:Do family serine endopeptidase [Burkholderiaceae bacterium]
MNKPIKLILTLAVAGASWLLGPAVTAQAQTTQSTPATQLPDFTGLVEKAGPAVVNIRTTQRLSAQRSPRGLPFPLPDGMDENDPLFEFFRRFFPPQQPGPNAPRGRGPGPEVPRGVGSGFIVSADGYVLTNHHVVDGAEQIYVTLSDDRELSGKLIGSDQRTDVALVKIEAADLPHVEIGDSSKLRVGEWVVAIGSPFGLNNTVTAGIVSAKSRDTGDYLPFIQTDVAVNPGNSGGPLLNMSGQVVGINSQIYSRTGGFMGISFAIPIDEAMRVADQLRDTGRVIRGRIGVGIDVTRDVAEPLGLPRTAGALVRSVERDGPADRAGVQVGDIILRFGDRQIDKASDLPRLVGGTVPGTRVDIEVWRRGDQRSLRLTVDELKPEASASAEGSGAQPGQTAPAQANSLGLAVTDIPDTRLAELRLKNGVLVEAVEGAAAAAGLREGDIVIAVNNTDVTSARQFDELVKKLDPSKSAVLLVRRGDAAQFVPIRPEQR